MSEKGIGKPEAESIVWRQFRKRKIGMVSLGVILCLFAIAVYAPLLANHNPLALYTTHAKVYAYYYAGLKAVHETASAGLAEQDQLIQQRKEALKTYATEREALKSLTTQYNSAGDRYDGARNKVNRTQDRIEEIDELTEEYESEGKSTKLPALKKEKEALLKIKPGYSDELKEAGAEKSKVKRSIDEHRGSQDQANQTVLQTNYRLNFDLHRKAIGVNLHQMKFPVDDATDRALTAVAERYEEIYNRLPNGEGPTLQRELGAIWQTVETTLAPEKVAQHIIHRWTFPALDALDWMDRFFMIGYPLLLLSILFRRKLGGTFFTRTVAVAALALALGTGSGALSAELPARNFKMILLENVTAGDTDTMAVMAPVPYGMNENRIEEKLQRPSFVTDEIGRRSLHWLGTDDSGRDVLSRMIWGARVSLSVGFVAVTLYLMIGIFVGSLAGYFGGKVDMLLSRIIEIVICFPRFFLILTVIAFIGPSIYNIMIVIGLTAWPGIARLTRGEFLRLRNQEFILAARAGGISTFSIMFKHVLPNALTPVMVAAAFGFAGSILTESGLSFLGFGVQEPFPSWGQMLSNSQSNPFLYWWMFVVPGCALFLTVTFYNLAGNTFRDAADPRLRHG